MEKLKTFYFHLTDASGKESIIGIEAHTLEEAYEYLQNNVASDEITFINECSD